MPGGGGEGLGVEVGRVWRAGAVLLPKVATQLGEAQDELQSSHYSLLYRGGGIGANPSSSFDALQRLVYRGLEDSAQAITDCGQALVWAAEDYELTDEAARDAYTREQNRID